MKVETSKLNPREEKILKLIGEKRIASNSALMAAISSEFPRLARITVIRDLNHLRKLKLIVRQGEGRSVVYVLSPQCELLRPLDAPSYFSLEPDKRQIKERFNFNLLTKLKSIFLVEEEARLAHLNQEYQRNVKKLPPSFLKREFERLTIELSWKSSAIEGNTYSLLETERLIKEGKKAAGKTKEETIMIINHKKALDYVRENIKNFKYLSLAKIEDIHYLLTQDLGISRGLRKFPVGVVGTKFKPLDNVFQIKEALEKTLKIVNAEKNIFAEAIILQLLIAYIQPFEDGNKRTGRLLANALLLAHQVCPLSYRSVDEGEYKKAVILFYEQNNLSYFKKLFIEQFEFAVKNYFRA